MTTLATASIPPSTSAASDVKKGIITPYICFFGRCEEALRFYEQHLGATITCKSYFRDMPGEGCPGLPPDKVMHAAMRIGNSEVFATDGCPDEKAGDGGRVSLSLAVQEPETVDSLAGVLAEKGQMMMPSSETFFAHRFAIVTDRFGVNWMLIVPKEQPAGA